MGRIVRNSIVLMFAAGWLWAGEASAQFRFGPFGWGIGLYDPARSTVNDINQRAQARGQAAYNAGGGGLSAAASPSSYFNRVRDDTALVPRYDVATRRPVERRVAPPPTPPPTPAASPAPAPPGRKRVPLESFFAGETLVWPSEAPVEGDLGAKREVSDRASLAVLRESQQQGFATIGSVTDARAKLLDYGRPALAFVMERTTPRIADAFHNFLLSLYDALEQAATPTPKAAGAAGP